jgi:hypothetical protein
MQARDRVDNIIVEDFRRLHPQARGIDASIHSRAVGALKNCTNLAMMPSDGVLDTAKESSDSG